MEILMNLLCFADSKLGRVVGIKKESTEETVLYNHLFNAF